MIGKICGSGVHFRLKREKVQRSALHIGGVHRGVFTLSSESRAQQSALVVFQHRQMRTPKCHMRLIHTGIETIVVAHDPPLQHYIKIAGPSPSSRSEFGKPV